MNSIGCRICNLRKQNGMSQEKLAEQLNVSRQSVSKWERDEALPDIFNLEAISEIFNVSMDYLVKNEQGADNNSPAVLSEEDILNREKLIKRANALLITAVAIYILDVFVVGGLWQVLPFAEAYKTVLFGIIAAIATGLIIYQGFIRNKIARLYSINKGQQKSTVVHYYRPSSSLLFTGALIVYLGLGFSFGLWEEAWGILPITILVSVFLKKINFVRRKQDTTEQKNSDS